MELEDFKRWHWVVISLAIGALLGYARTWSSPDETSSRRGISAYEFAQQMNRPKTGNGYAWISDVTIYPPETTFDGATNKEKQVNFVTCTLLKQTAPTKAKPEQVQFMADIPFKVLGFSDPKSDRYSVRDYLTDMKKDHEEIQFKYAWWRQSRTEMAIWMGGSLVLIGGIWPSVVSVMIGAGLGRPKKDKSEEEYDLDRFGKHKEPSKPAVAVKPGMTASEAQQLSDMQAEMEKNLAAAGMAMTSGAGGEVAAATGSATGVKKLTGGPVEVAAAGTGAPEEPREYTGEYYPVVKAHHDEKK
jgi:hypothetical protein